MHLHSSCHACLAVVTVQRDTAEELLSPCAWSSLSDDEMEHAGGLPHPFALQLAPKTL